MNPELQLRSAVAVIEAADYLPDAVWTAWYRYQAVRDYEAAHVDLAADLANLDHLEVPEVLARHVDHEARRAAIDAVRAQAIDVTGRALAAAIGAQADQLLNDRHKAFTDAAGVVTEVVGVLPVGYGDPAVLVRAGSEALAAFERARAAADQLDGIAAVRDSLADLGYTAAGPLERSTRYATWPSAEAARDAVAAVKGATSHPLGRWGALVDAGGTLCLPTVTDQRRHLAQLEESERRAEADTLAARRATSRGQVRRIA